MHTIGNVASQSANVSLAAYCLQLPGQKLHLSVLLAAKTFRGSVQSLHVSVQSLHQCHFSFINTNLANNLSRITLV